MFMKKLYSLLAVAAVSIGAVAQNTVFKEVSTLPVRETATKIISASKKAIDATNVTTTATASRATSIADFEGTFDWTFFRPLGDGADVTGDLTFTAVEGEVDIIAMSGFFNDMEAIGSVDIEAGTITFDPMQNLGLVNVQGLGIVDTYLEFRQIVQNGESASLVEYTEPLVFTLTETGYEVDPTLVFGVSVYKSDDTLAGWLELCAFNEITKPVQDPNWVEVGTAVFKDAIISGTYAETAPQTFTCPVEVSQLDDNLIRLVNPYKEAYGVKSYLVIDMTDPNNIVIPYQFTGITDNVDGITYCASYSGLWDPTPEKNRITLSDNVINMPIESTYLIWPEAPEDSKWETSPTTAYVSCSTAGSTITLPGDALGITDIITDKTENENAPVEYFNLQGMKVKNPAAGQLYIVRQGNDVKKMIVR